MFLLERDQNLQFFIITSHQEHNLHHAKYYSILKIYFRQYIKNIYLPALPHCMALYGLV